MALHAVINNNVVERLEDLGEEAVSAFARVNQAVVDVSDMNPLPYVGQGWDGISFVGHVPARWITKLAFMNRFTDAELLAIETASESASTAGRFLRIIRKKQELAQYIDLDRTDTITGVYALATSFALITPERAAEILSAPISDLEKYREGTIR